MERKVLGSLTGPGWLGGHKRHFSAVTRPFSATSACFPGDQCPPGFVLGPQQLHCLDINECAEGSHACRYNQICENTVGTHRCVCPRGYRSLGAAWPCLGTSPAPPGHVPVPLPAPFPHHVPPSLFAPSDINECLHFPPPCAFECRNLRGSYECLCPPGMVLLPEDHCVPKSLPKNLHLPIVAASPGSFAPSPTVSGSRQAWLCREGEVGAPQQRCRNGEGSYRCVCPPGYRLLPDGKSCQGTQGFSPSPLPTPALLADVDECGEGTLQCASGQLCFNTRGGARCEDTPCPDGYWRGSTRTILFPAGDPLLVEEPSLSPAPPRQPPPVLPSPGVSP
uniref:EGF-like domain-containing protein n=1 Tax=Anas platyrhynchos TaxID=8839 RepID=A0A8B9ZFI6_ANAPL